MRLGVCVCVCARAYVRRFATGKGGGEEGLAHTHALRKKEFS